MPWQDVVIGFVQWVLFLALLPSIWSPHKPALLSSIVMAASLSVLAFTFFTLGYWNATIALVANVLGWVVLGVQRYHHAKGSSR